MDLRGQLEQLVADGFAAVDNGHATDSLGQLTADFAIGEGERRVGRPVYDQVMAVREKAVYTTRHVPTNFRVTTDDQESFQADFVVTVHRIEPEPGGYTVSIFDFCDTWVRDGNGGLLLRLREVTTVIDTVTSRPTVAELLNQES
ncbi:MAG: hypothetical protein JWO57_4065 [Pseudonocardiales bacterium]|nr:hypothetical protein [Pseudonocardiales bacterium]